MIEDAEGAESWLSELPEGALRNIGLAASPQALAQ